MYQAKLHKHGKKVIYSEYTATFWSERIFTFTIESGRAVLHIWWICVMLQLVGMQSQSCCCSQWCEGSTHFITVLTWVHLSACDRTEIEFLSSYTSSFWVCHNISLRSTGDINQSEHRMSCYEPHCILNKCTSVLQGCGSASCFICFPPLENRLLAPTTLCRPIYQVVVRHEYNRVIFFITTTHIIVLD